ncbi:hypothetical protein HUA74_43920 [Myxococcus sp. CA051A]|uniref:hypothetical protein n=1 Tax=Myxococcus sp. CA051A TaxID=2741739 RepID=UPI00157A674C|nr:hypothetical protein [Myxococcus sp. CA051A]NTX67617.1 hypothetical protein [Myxococcus sp. CA051A]
MLVHLAFDIYEGAASVTFADLLMLAPADATAVGLLLSALSAGPTAVADWCSHNRSNRLFESATDLDRRARRDESTTGTAENLRRLAANARALANDVSPDAEGVPGQLLSITRGADALHVSLAGRPVVATSVLELLQGRTWRRGFLHVKDSGPDYRGRFHLAPARNTPPLAGVVDAASLDETSQSLLLSKTRFRWPEE